MSKVKKIQLPSGTQLDLGAGYDWIGTKAQYDTAWAAGEIESDWVCIITDDAMDHATKANIDLDNLSDTGSKMMDGQWVAKTATLSTATAVGTYTIDLSDYLPDDNYNYECMIQGDISRQDASNANSNVYIANTSDIANPNIRLHLQGGTSSTDATATGGYAIFNVDLDRTIFLNIRTTATSSAFVYLSYYRRVGTNN